MNDLKNKRIVIFNGSLMQGGAERVISILSRHMIDQGFGVEIVLFLDREVFYEIDPRVKLTVAEKETGSSNLVKNLFWLRRYFKKNADIILSFLAPFNLLALTAHIGQKSKILVADRNDPRKIPTNPLLRAARNFLYRFADGVILQTTHNKAYFSKSIQKKSIVIGNPVDLGDKRAIALLTEKKPEIVSAGRLKPQKNQAMLLRAFARIAPAYPAYKLTIYGEGPERGNLEALARELGIADKVSLPGAAKDLLDRIPSAELFVLPSDYEGMSNALIEAMCLGLPCISTDVSGASDLIEPGKSGEIIPVGDTEALVCAMRKLLSDKQLANEYAVAATATNETLETNKILREWIEFLSSL